LSLQDHGKSAKSLRRLSHRFAAALFLVALFIPLIGTLPILQFGQSLNEKRTLAPFPAWPTSPSAASGFPSQFLSYYRDHFGFRATLIHQLMLAQIEWLKFSPNPSVILGDDGWLFYRLGDSPGADAHHGLAPLTPPELDTWQRVLLQRRDWLAARKIAYLVVIVPEKQTIYPEFLPPAMRDLQRDAWIDQLVARLDQAAFSQSLLDLRPVLLRGKSQGQVYWKADTHWNPVGVYLAYRAIMEKLHTLLPDKPLTILTAADFKTFTANGAGGDLADLLAAPELFNEPFQAMVLPDQTLPPRNQHQQLYIVDGDPRMPRLVMYHDSFGYFLIPLFARSFSHGVYFWGKHNMTSDFIAKHRPDVVIDEFAERFLDGERWEEPEISDESNPR
jgi:alginate O-acetyltransferase complex protein AlgJ